MDIIKELSESQACLLLMPGMEYNSLILETIRQLSKKKVCYVTLNKTYDSLKELFRKNRANLANIVFIDAISKTIKKVPDQVEGCYFCSSPAALTELSLAITKVIKHNFDYLIFDSLTNLLVYTKKAPVAQFLSGLINKIRDTKVKAVFYSLKMEQHQELIQEASMFVDKVMDLGG
ncbi:hypothetical protein KY358_00115 [Candidatus Woesearchaeota archaeon]|nr:hypothetical protein [Candidatus Woesearchaeota archaeon]